MLRIQFAFKVDNAVAFVTSGNALPVEELAAHTLTIAEHAGNLVGVRLIAPSPYAVAIATEKLHTLLRASGRFQVCDIASTAITLEYSNLSRASILPNPYPRIVPMG